MTPQNHYQGFPQHCESNGQLQIESDPDTPKLPPLSGFLESPTCLNCKEFLQDIDHLIKDSHNKKLAGGLKVANDCDFVFKDWIERSRIKV